jgi:hypothetical protein
MKETWPNAPLGARTTRVRERPLIQPFPAGVHASVIPPHSACRRMPRHPAACTPRAFRSLDLSPTTQDGCSPVLDSTACTRVDAVRTGGRSRLGRRVTRCVHQRAHHLTNKTMATYRPGDWSCCLCNNHNFGCVPPPSHTHSRSSGKPPERALGFFPHRTARRA